MKNQPFPKKLRNAFAGIRYVWEHENNFRLQIVLGFVTLAAFILIQPAALWWGLITLCVTLVLVAELVNSAIEMLIDNLHPEFHAVVGKVKDMLAGMVLVMSVGAAIVAMIAVYATLFA